MPAVAASWTVYARASFGICRNLGEVEVWDRGKSALQISGLIAESEALYALETMQAVDAEPVKASAYSGHGLMIL